MARLLPWLTAVICALVSTGCGDPLAESKAACEQAGGVYQGGDARADEVCPVTYSGKRYFVNIDVTTDEIVTTGREDCEDTNRSWRERLALRGEAAQITNSKRDQARFHLTVAYVRSTRCPSHLPNAIA